MQRGESKEMTKRRTGGDQWSVRAIGNAVVKADRQRGNSATQNSGFDFPITRMTG